MGVAEDFSTFKDNYNITSELITSISYRYKRITKQLNKDFWIPTRTRRTVSTSALMAAILRRRV